MDNYLKLSVKSDCINEHLSRQVIATFMTSLDPTLEEICDVKTAVSEAVTNAIVHGYENLTGTVNLTAEINGKELYIEVEDYGRGIADVERAREPLYTSQPEKERSGMGFTVMEAFMDYVDVISRPGLGTKVIMKKLIGVAHEM
ncbi:MAG: anti-sigma F factor [Clostridia bacterium]|nr:anti-sigma F factor [Clostridia bacterium]